MIFKTPKTLLTLAFAVMFAFLAPTGYRSTALGNEVAIVVPNELADREGDSVHEITRTFPTGFRLQSIMLASEFQALPDTARWITAIEFRPDGNLRSGSFVREWPYLTLRLSTTNQNLNTLSTVFADNIGDDETTIHDGPIVFSTANAGPPGGPKDFDYHVALESTFYYDPSRGNLLFDWYAPAPTFAMLGTGWDEHSYSSSLRWIGNLNPEASFANIGDSGVTPTQFIFFSPTDPCDVNEDGACNVADIDELAAAIRSQVIEPEYDVNVDGDVNAQDHRYWVHDSMNTWIGDANLDGEFNTGDLVDVLQAGKYETEQSAGWGEGDWTGDNIFDTGDLVAALDEGGYENGPKVAAVPEPKSLVMLMTGLIGVAIRRREIRS